MIIIIYAYLSVDIRAANNVERPEMRNEKLIEKMAQKFYRFQHPNLYL